MFLAFAESIQLFPDGTIFIHIALILLMIWALNRTFFRPINRVIESREKRTGGAGSETEEILASAAQKEARLNEEMLSARSEGYELIEKERAAAVEQRSKRIADAKSEAMQRLEDEKRALAQQAEAARSAIATEAEVLAERISANVLKA